MALQKTRLARILFLLGGLLAVALGVLGIFLPVLPTTPFLLLAAWCFMRSSPRLHHWLLHHRVLGKYIYNYITYRAIPRRAKIVSLLTLWGTLLLSVLAVRHLHLTLFLGVVGIAVSTHILLLRTLPGKPR